MSDESLRVAASETTSGTWSSGGIWWEHWTDPEGRKCHTPWPTVTTGHVGSEIVAKARTEGDAAYIAAASPDVVLDLLDRLERAEAAVERVRALLDQTDRVAREQQHLARLGTSEVWPMIRAALDQGEEL